MSAKGKRGEAQPEHRRTKPDPTYVRQQVKALDAFLADGDLMLEDYHRLKDEWMARMKADKGDK